jgi:hypothetical protein
MDAEREDYDDGPLPRPWWLPSWGILTLIALVIVLALLVRLHNALLVRG